MAVAEVIAQILELCLLVYLAHIASFGVTLLKGILDALDDDEDDDWSGEQTDPKTPSRDCDIDILA